MLDRAHLEFLQSQNLPWRLENDGSRVKILSCDPVTRAQTYLLEIGRGGVHTLPGDRDCEIFVIRGAFDTEIGTIGLHHYAFLPGTAGSELLCEQNGLAIVCTWGRIGGHPAMRVDSLALAWERVEAAHIAHLNAFRKNLRLDPDGRCRTYLLSGLPQGVPSVPAEQLEAHPHVGEAFMIAGDMSTWRGIMRAGAYIWRPPNLLHGADCSQNGFFLFMRTPGVNRTSFSFDGPPVQNLLHPEHRPILPPGINADIVADPVRY